MELLVKFSQKHILERIKAMGGEESDGLCFFLSCQFIFGILENKDPVSCATQIMNEENEQILKKYICAFNIYKEFYKDHASQTFLLMQKCVEITNLAYAAHGYAIDVESKDIKDVITKIGDEANNLNLIIALNYHGNIGHAIAIIKTGEQFYLFDSNYGLASYTKSESNRVEWYKSKIISSASFCNIARI